MRRHGLAELLSSMGEDDDEGSTILPEAQIETLKEIAARYAAGCTFKAGDIVTPRRGFNVKGAGVPHIVLEVLPKGEAIMPTREEAGSSSFGVRFNMRVACLTHSKYAAYWVEHWAFELYSG